MSLRTIARPAAVSVSSIMLVVGLAACSPESVIENAIEDKTGVDVKEDGDSFTITDEEGSTTEFNQDDDGWVTIESGDGSVYSQGEGIPPDFPSAIPLIDLPVTLGVSSLTADGTQAYMITMESDECDGAFEDAASRLTSDGYTEESSTVMDSSDGYFAFGTWIGAHKVSLSVTDDDGCIVGYTVEVIEG